jgi:hypothetical protein
MMEPIVTLLQHPQGADRVVIVIIDLARNSSLIDKILNELDHARRSARLTLKQYMDLWYAAMCALVSKASDDSTSNFRVIALTLKRIDRKEWFV